MNATDRDETKAKLLQLLEPCLTDEPTAGAVLVINNAKGSSFFSINMDSEEIVETLINSGIFLAIRLGIDCHEDRVLQ